MALTKSFSAQPRGPAPGRLGLFGQQHNFPRPPAPGMPTQETPFNFHQRPEAPINGVPRMLYGGPQPGPYRPQGFMETEAYRQGRNIPSAIASRSAQGSYDPVSNLGPMLPQAGSEQYEANRLAGQQYLQADPNYAAARQAHNQQIGALNQLGYQNMAGLMGDPRMQRIRAGVGPGEHMPIGQLDMPGANQFRQDQNVDARWAGHSSGMNYGQPQQVASPEGYGQTNSSVMNNRAYADGQQPPPGGAGYVGEGPRQWDMQGRQNELWGKYAAGRGGLPSPFGIDSQISVNRETGGLVITGNKYTGAPRGLNGSIPTTLDAKGNVIAQHPNDQRGLDTRSRRFADMRARRNSLQDGVPMLPDDPVTRSNKRPTIFPENFQPPQQVDENGQPTGQVDRESLSKSVGEFAGSYGGTRQSLENELNNMGVHWDDVRSHAISNLYPSMMQNFNHSGMFGGGSWDKSLHTKAENEALRRRFAEYNNIRRLDPTLPELPEWATKHYLNGGAESGGGEGEPQGQGIVKNRPVSPSGSLSGRSRPTDRGDTESERYANRVRNRLSGR